MVVELLAFLAVALVVLSSIGFGIIELALPGLGGMRWLLSPVAGLAVLYLACQWLSPVLSSEAIVLVVLALGSLLSAQVAWRERHQLVRTLVAARFDLVTTAVLGASTYLALLAHQLRLGFFTLAATGLDALFIYAPVAEFMGAHAYAAGAIPAVKTPAISTLQANFYPGSLGTVDGGLSTLIGRPAYQILEPFNAVCSVLALAGVYVLVVGALRQSRITGVLAVALVGSNQFLFWSSGFDFVQQLRASAILPGALALVVYAFDGRGMRPAVVAGAMGAALVAIYMPVFLVLVVAVSGGLLAVGVVSVRRRQALVRPPVVAAMLTGGVVFGLPHIRWLFFNGGWEAWNLVSQDRFGPYAAGGILATHYEPGQLLGTASLADAYRLKPLLFWGGGLTALGNVVALISIALSLLGLVWLVHHGRWSWVGMVGGALSYVLYVRYGTHNLYGFVKTVSYVVPFVSVLVAVGALTLASVVSIRLAKRAAVGSMSRRLPFVVTGSAVALILGMQLGAALETEHLFLQLPPTISKEERKLEHLGDVVPTTASVLIRDPGPVIPGTPATRYTKVNHIAAYFLSNRDVTLGTPLDPIGVDPSQYAYVLEPTTSAAPPGYRPVWAEDVLGLSLYEIAR